MISIISIQTLTCIFYDCRYATIISSFILSLLMLKGRSNLKVSPLYMVMMLLNTRVLDSGKKRVSHGKITSLFIGLLA